VYFTYTNTLFLIFFFLSLTFRRRRMKYYPSHLPVIGIIEDWRGEGGGVAIGGQWKAVILKSEQNATHATKLPSQ
jgi:hypothetical protein